MLRDYCANFKTPKTTLASPVVVKLSSYLLLSSQ